MNNPTPLLRELVIDMNWISLYEWVSSQNVCHCLSALTRVSSPTAEKIVKICSMGGKYSLPLQSLSQWHWSRMMLIKFISQIIKSEAEWVTLMYRDNHIHLCQAAVEIKYSNSSDCNFFSILWVLASKMMLFENGD